jgi:hypothetical protein
MTQDPDTKPEGNPEPEPTAPLKYPSIGTEPGVENDSDE